MARELSRDERRTLRNRGWKHLSRDEAKRPGPIRSRDVVEIQVPEQVAQRLDPVDPPR